MAKLFKSTENRIFRDERVLLPDFIPDFLPHREKELREIALVLKVTAEGRRPENFIIFGSTGTGKTTCVKYVLNELKEFTKAAIPIYINCWEQQTATSVLAKIAENLNLAIPRRGVAKDEIRDRIFETLKKENKIAIVVLDEFDRLLASKDGEDVLYDLCRAKENFGVSTSLICITNISEIMVKIDERIRSSLMRRIEFSRYMVDELKDILRGRAKLAFFPNVLDEEVIPFCAAHAAKKGGDARVAISLLHKAGLKAEIEEKGKVMVEHVASIIGETDSSKGERKIGEMSKVEVAIIEILRAGPSISGELMKELGKAGIKLRKTAFNEYVKKLEDVGIVESSAIAMRPRGRSKLFKLK